MAERRWHACPIEAVAAWLKTDPSRGLTGGEARRRLAQVGENLLAARPRPAPWRLFLAQFTDFTVLVLLGATLVSAVLGEMVDAVTILLIVLLNGILGFVQEYRAERCLAALRELSAPAARVVRDGEPQTIPAGEVVPGDVVLLATGDRVPADLRLSETVALEVDEAALTGESVPVGKTAETLGEEGAALADQRNMAFLGTLVTRGHGRGVAVATGRETEMGKIARLIAESDDQTTPLQRRLEELGRWLVAGCGAVCLGVFIFGVMQGRPVRDMFLTGVSLAVAAIPEGLPTVVTVALAAGVQRMSRRGAIIRRLPAVETLGCTTVICADKTGTLTKSEMTVREVWAGGRSFTVEGTGYRPEGEFREAGRAIQAALLPELRRALEIGLLCNTATLMPPAGRERQGRPARGWRVEGDPTEGALLVAAGKAGLARREYERTHRLVTEVPFSPERRRMTAVWTTRAGQRLVCTKGALDVVLACCRAVSLDGREEPLTEERRRQVLAEGERMAAAGLRVLGLAYRLGGGAAAESGPGSEEERWERDLMLAGVVGLYDPPRPEAAEAIRVARSAGVRTIMITGDHALTAASIANQLGLAPPGAPVVTGNALETLPEQELQRLVRHVSVYARVSPAHKLRLVKALQAGGEVVAMTGDGVNDAPAIRQADIGIAMGLQGTDVAKEASAMVLADDNYATIVRAIEEGRRIYENVRKFIRYLLTCNVGEVLAMAVAVALNLPLPLLAIQILYMNLVTDGLPALALGLDSVDAGVMVRPPRRRNEGIFAGGLLGRILSTGALIGLNTVAVFLLTLSFGYPVERARTIAFTTLVLAQLFYVFRCRETPRGLEYQVFGNPRLLLAVMASFVMQLAVVYVPAMAAVFRTVPLGATDWFLILVAASYASMVGDLRPAHRPRRTAAARAA
ncbi:MAG: cation-translocating P-type ATPase [Bacillota bacterium]|nr:cation-translocating P-type ATPase [Bacillota bacterium]